MNLTDQFLDLITRVSSKGIPHPAESMLRTCLADTMGVTIAGATDLREKEAALLKELDDGASVVAPIIPLEFT